MVAAARNMEQWAVRIIEGPERAQTIAVTPQRVPIGAAQPALITEVLEAEEQTTAVA
jgi:hypothetical protein